MLLDQFEQHVRDAQIPKDKREFVYTFLKISCRLVEFGFKSDMFNNNNKLQLDACHEEARTKREEATQKTSEYVKKLELARMSYVGRCSRNQNFPHVNIPIIATIPPSILK